MNKELVLKKKKTVVPCVMEASVLDLMKLIANYKIAVSFVQQSLEGYTHLRYES